MNEKARNDTPSDSEVTGDPVRDGETIEERAEASLGAADALAGEDTAPASPAASAEHRPDGETTAPDAAAGGSAGKDIFPPLASTDTPAHTRELEMVMDIPVTLSVELGRTRIAIKQLLELAQGSVVKLDGLPGEPMDILINGHLVAQGEVVVVEEKFGIRVTEIITPSERLQRLNR